MTNLIPLLGAHVSAAGGVHHAIENGEKICASCIQIFGASPRQWKMAVPSKEICENFKAAQKKSDIKAVFLHAAYLINLSALDEELYQKSIECLSGHLAIAEALGAQGVVFHVQSIFQPKIDPVASKKVAVERTASAMKKILKNVPGTAKLIMENNAGKSTRLGSILEDLAALLKAIDSPRAKVCLDTAHSFGSGLMSDFSPKKVNDFVDHIEETIGITNLAAMHINDSKAPAGSFRDRHENLGKGHIGLAGFKALAKEKRLHHAAWILEVPGFDGNGPDKKNLDILKSLF